MTAQHTPERLRVATDGSIGSIETVSGKSIGQTFQTRPIRDASDHQERIANANRLVACWNACDGISTDLLENIVITGDTIASRFNSRAKYEREITRQRDELLAALKHIEGLALADEWRDLPEIAKQARAAIAKAEGGAA